MEYREDLKKLSWDALYQRLVNSEASLESYGADRKILVARIESLRSELRAAQDSLAKLEAKKEAEPIPAFEIGKCYLDGDGECWGPLELNSGNFANTHPLRCRHGSWTLNGICHIDGKTTSQDDLLPGAVEPLPTWTPPKSLNDCEATSTGDGFRETVAFLHCTHDRMKELYRDYIQPADGRWQVKDGKATYLGEA